MINLSGKTTALYRHPIKGFTPEAVREVYLAEDAFFPFDRVYTFEVGPSGYLEMEPKFLSKMKYAVLARFPAVARMKTRYDEVDDHFHVDELSFDLKSDAGRHSLCRHIENVLMAHDDYDPVMAPLRLLTIREDDLAQFRFTDSPKGFVSLLNLNSLRDLEMRTGTTLDGLRLRANIWLEDLEAFEDHDWVGRRLSFGEDGPELEVIKPIVRCMATHVNPDTAIRDFDMVKALWDNYGHKDLGVYCRVVRSGTIIL
jgi:uncharacterized protein